MTPKGLALLKQLEGEVKRNGRHVVYDDATSKPIEGHKARGTATIGHGHAIKPGERFPRKGITDAEAEALLREDIVPAEKAVADLVTTRLNSNQSDALTIFAFNLGRGNFRRSTTLKRVNDRDFEGAAEAMHWWNKTTISGEKVVSPGLVKRRIATSNLFLQPVREEPPPEPSPRQQPASFWARVFPWLKK